MKLQKFNDFKTSAINEMVDEESKYVFDKSIPDEKALIERIKENIKPAFDRFCKKHNIPVKNSKFDIYEKNGSTYITFDNDKITEGFGELFKHSVNHIKFAFFSGKQISFGDFKGVFKFRPHIWTDLHIEIDQISGGTSLFKYIIDIDSNDAFISSRADVYYNILNNEWESYADHWIEELGHRISNKLIKNNKNTGVFEEEL